MTEERYVKLVIDATTGTQEEIEMTAEEITEVQAMQIEFERRKEEEIAAAEANAAAKASAEAKLSSLGLTPEEIAAITK
jgi:hypothetical protein